MTVSAPSRPSTLLDRGVPSAQAEAKARNARANACVSASSDVFGHLSVISLALAVVLPLLATAAAADTDNLVHGRIELQEIGSFTRSNTLDAELHAQDRSDFNTDIRITWEPVFGRWSALLHYVVDADYGDGVRLARDEAGLVPAPSSTWFDLTETFENHADFFATQRIDRIALAYTAPDFVLRLGRQALTWGSGLVFRPMDLFDPFSPTATDTEWKPGTDMVYAQYLFADGSDLQFIAVPRTDSSSGRQAIGVGSPPPSGSGALTWDASSFALHFHTTIADHATTLLVARDHGDWVLAAGLNGALAGATWNIEFVPTFLETGGARVSALANISDAITVAGHNTTVFAEYFHNGFGVTGSDVALATLPPDLLDRLARGQLFNLRQNYLAAGFTMEVNPLLDASPTLLADLDDGSLYALFQASYSLDEDLTLIAGAQAPIGPSGSEFGGIHLAPGGNVFLGSPARLYVQLRRYF